MNGIRVNIIDTPVRPADAWDTHLKPEYLEKYGVGDTFIETGTYLGDTVRMVLQTQKGRFNQIYTIELDESLGNKAKDMFTENRNVCVLIGDSPDCLNDLINRPYSGLNVPCTFWLDAHASGPLPGGRYGGCPILEELEAIKKSNQPNHTIFIDDRRLFSSEEFGFVLESDVLTKLQEINPNYKLVYLDGHQAKDVICVFVEKPNE